MYGGVTVAISFKSDESFLRKLAVGAAGTNATMARLKDMGFDPIELERGSTGFKIWKKIKIKRIRVPDILCLRTGLRFESRGKTKPELSMSHSLNNPKRAWDTGMRDGDFVSVVFFEQRDDSPLDLLQVSPVHFIRVRDMRKAFADQEVSITRPKGVEEGSEIRVVWTCATARRQSLVSAVEPRWVVLDSASEGKRQRIQLKRDRGRITLLPQVNTGDTVEVNQIVAAVVPVETSLALPAAVDEAHFVEKLASVSLSERYAAAKALRFRGYSTAGAALRSRMNDVDEDIYVQLEAAAALAAYEDSTGWDFMEGNLRGSALTVPLETQLETIIVLSEISREQSEHLLIDVLQDSSRNEELRAGAAWALGQFASGGSASALVDTFNASPLEVKIEAARALLRIAEPQVPHILDMLRNADYLKRDGIAWVLARTGGFNPCDVIGGADDNLRRWMSYIIGYGKDQFAQTDIEAICKADPEVYFAASVLWQLLSSWVSNLEEY